MAFKAEFVTNVSPLPATWPVLKVADVARVNEATINEKSYKGWIEYIDISSVEEHKLLDTQIIDFDSAPSRARRIVRDNDILISTVRPNLKHFVFIKKVKPNYVASTGFAVISPSKNVEPRYLYYYLTSDTFTDYLSCVADGGAYPAFNPEEIRTAEIPLPLLPEQKAIASILGTLDDKIELSRKMNETLEAMARAIFKSWFVDFDPIPGLGPHKEWQDSPLGKIPKVWRVLTLGDIAENIRNGIDPEHIAPDMPYIGLEHMPRHSITLFDWGKAKDIVSNKFLFRKNDILFGKLRPYFHKVGIATLDGCCSTDILVISPKETIWHGVVLFHISSDDFINYADGTSSGTKMPRTNWTDMARYKIVFPGNVIAEKFNDVVWPMVQTIQANIQQSRTLAIVRDVLLSKMLSGVLRVPTNLLED